MKILSCRINKKASLVYLLLFCLGMLFSTVSPAQKKPTSKKKVAKSKSTNKRVIYGLASFYADKFNGRKTASGEIFRQHKFTCACNMLPFGTWVRITNVQTGKLVIVKVNDRLHTKMRRLVDLSKAAARQLGYTHKGLIRVKLEVIGKKKP